jgi:Lecithin retinol acyltransferase
METQQTEDMASEQHDSAGKPLSCRGLRACDRPLDPKREPPLGAHMVTPRRGYTHHGIYVGEGKVIQYGGLSWGLRRGPVEEVSLAQFSQGRPVWVRVVGAHWFDRHEVVRRARLRLGEDRYSVLTNNCEHFCEWCVRGQHRSYQVDDRMAGYKGVVLKLIELLARTRAQPRGSSATDLFASRLQVDHDISLRS